MKPEIILLMQTGLDNREIVAKTGYSPQLVSYYRKQFAIGHKRFLKIMKK